MKNFIQESDYNSKFKSTNISGCYPLVIDLSDSKGSYFDTDDSKGSYFDSELEPCYMNYYYKNHIT